MQSFKNHFVAALGAVVATGISIVAVSPASAETLQTRVRYSDLDLASADGKAMLDSRIRKAAHVVCRANGLPRDAVSRCYRDAVTGGQRNVTAIAQPAIVVAAR